MSDMFLHHSFIPPICSYVGYSQRSGRLATPRAVCPETCQQLLSWPGQSVRKQVRSRYLTCPGQSSGRRSQRQLSSWENQPFDSEDSLSQEHVASELRRLNELRVSTSLAEMRARVASDSNQNLEEGAVAPGAEESTVPMTTHSRQGAVAPDSEGNREDNEAYAPQRSDRFCGRLRSPAHICSVPPSG